MDVWNNLLQGFLTAGTPINLLWALVGCTIGTAVGVLPGIGPATAVAHRELEAGRDLTSRQATAAAYEVDIWLSQDPSLPPPPMKGRS